MGSWGTWEELLLGGAVLRHGTGDWNVVAAELRARTVSPYHLTPERKVYLDSNITEKVIQMQVCKAKYEDLQQRYSGCKSWFEELRKKRMEELKEALEQSEDSIGSLETKLESLKTKKANKEDGCHTDRGSSQTELLVPFLKSSRTESSSKETSKDGLSAGSFTHETRTNWMNDCQVPAALSAEEMEITEELPLVLEKFSSFNKLALPFCGLRGGNLKRRRGKRKRKDCCKSIKSGSVGESDFFGLVDVISQCKDISTTTSNCKLAKSSDLGNDSGRLSKDNAEFRKKGANDLYQILSSVMEDKGVSTFHRPLDSQKRGRYKKMIRRHMDFDTIRSRIDNKTIQSAMELFRDLLLLANNALVFYSRSTREYKTARLLRDIVAVKLREHRKNFIGSKMTSNNVSVPTPVPIPVVKPRSARPAKKSKVLAKLPASGSRASNVTKMPSTPDSSPSVESLVVRKKAFRGQRKTERGGVTGQRRAIPVKTKKRVRRK